MVAFANEGSLRFIELGGLRKLLLKAADALRGLAIHFSAFSK